jgi:acetylornithine/succinyldiaminopimelate/putrescine aminotransferase
MDLEKQYCAHNYHPLPVVRLAPPLIIGRTEIDWAVMQIADVLQEMDKVRLAS